MFSRACLSCDLLSGEALLRELVMPDGQRHTFISRCQPGKNHSTWGFGAGSSPWEIVPLKTTRLPVPTCIAFDCHQPLLQTELQGPTSWMQIKTELRIESGKQVGVIWFAWKSFLAVEASQIPWAPHPSGNKPYRAWGPGPNRVSVIWMFTATAVAPSAGHCHWFCSILLPHNPPVHVSG